MPRMRIEKSLFLFLVTFSASPQTFAFGVDSRRNIAIVSKGKSKWLKMATSEGSADTSLDNPAQEIRVIDCNIVWDVDRYQKQHSFVWQYGSSLVDLVQPVDGERILDVGCGTGELTHGLAQAASADPTRDKTHFMGMDADPAMVAQAKKQFPEQTFFQGDIRNFELEEPVDVIFSNAALHWIPPRDVDRAVASMAAALKPGGRFIVEFGGKDNVESIVRATLQVLHLLESASPWYFPSIANFTTILERHDIEVTTALLFDRPVLLQDGEDRLGNWLRMFGNKFFEDLSPDEVAQVLVQVNDKLRPVLFDGEQWTADYRRIRVVGRKIGGI